MSERIVVAAHQPNFLPNLNFFYKMSQADIFVIVTNLQFERQEGWQRRNRFCNNHGEDMWMTVPLLGSQEQLIKDVKIKYERDWIRKFKATFEMNYYKSKEKEVLKRFFDILESKYERLVDLNFEIICAIKELLGIRTPVFLDEEVFGTKHELIINICKKYGGNVYLSGTGAGYMTDERVNSLSENGISHEFLKESPARDKKYSALHYILIEGCDETARLLMRRMIAPQISR